METLKSVGPSGTYMGPYGGRRPDNWGPGGEAPRQEAVGDLFDPLGFLMRMDGYFRTPKKHGKSLMYSSSFVKLRYSSSE